VQFGSAGLSSDQPGVAPLGTAQLSPVGVSPAQLGSGLVGMAWFGDWGLLRAIPVPVPVTLGALRGQRGAERQGGSRSPSAALVRFAGNGV